MKHEHRGQIVMVLRRFAMIHVAEMITLFRVRSERMCRVDACMAGENARPSSSIECVFYLALRTRPRNRSMHAIDICIEEQFSKFIFEWCIHRAGAMLATLAHLCATCHFICQIRAENYLRDDSSRETNETGRPCPVPHCPIVDRNEHPCSYIRNDEEAVRYLASIARDFVAAW